MGSDVAFASEAPSLAVAAHEVVHTLQQGTEPMALGREDAATPLTSDGPYEAEAHTLGALVATGHSVAGHAITAAPRGVQRFGGEHSTIGQSAADLSARGQSADSRAVAAVDAAGGVVLARIDAPGGGQAREYRIPAHVLNYASGDYPGSPE